MTAATYSLSAPLLFRGVSRSRNVICVNAIDMPLNYAWCSDFAKQNVAGTRRGEQCGMFSEDLHFKEQRREREIRVYSVIFANAFLRFSRLLSIESGQCCVAAVYFYCD